MAEDEKKELHSEPQGEECKNSAVLEPSSLAQLSYDHVERGECENRAALEPSSLYHYSISPMAEIEASPIEVAERKERERIQRELLRYMQELDRWEALPWWKKKIVKKPEPPQGI
jgi:hypothetical protein